MSEVKSAVRVMEILEAFSMLKRPMSLKEIVSRLEYPGSSAVMLLKSMVQQGYLNYDRCRRVYQPTLKVVSLGSWIEDILAQDSGDVPRIMQQLSEQTGETISLVQLNDVHIQYIRVLQSTHALRFYTEQGSMRPWTQSFVGWLLASERSEEDIDKLVRRANLVIPASERVPVELIFEHLHALRNDKVFFLEGLPHREGASMVMRLPHYIHGQVAALGIGGGRERMLANRARYTRLMEDALDELRLARPKAAA